MSTNTVTRLMEEILWDSLMTMAGFARGVIGMALGYHKAPDVGTACPPIAWPSKSEIAHTLLGLAGMIPALGVVPDLVDAALYLAEGKRKDAAMSVVFAIPGIGDVAGPASTASMPWRACTMPPGAVRKKVHSVYSDGTRVLEDSSHLGLKDLIRKRKELPTRCYARIRSTTEPIKGAHSTQMVTR